MYMMQLEYKGAPEFKRTYKNCILKYLGCRSEKLLPQKAISHNVNTTNYYAYDVK